MTKNVKPENLFIVNPDGKQGTAAHRMLGFGSEREKRRLDGVSIAEIC